MFAVESCLLFQAQIYRLHAAESSSDSKPVSPVSQDATASSNLVLLHEAVASLQLLVTQGVTEWQAALEDERTARMAGDAACSALVSSESKERTTDLDELADDVREQVRPMCGLTEGIRNFTTLYLCSLLLPMTR